MLKGEHYGTPADVFSFGIVVCELLTLRAPYSDIIQGGVEKEGGEPMTWDQIVALTHKEGVLLRPTLGDDINHETATFVRSCWANDPAVRPSFPVILLHLDEIAQRAVAQREWDKEAGELRIQHRRRKAMRAFLRSFHDLLWLFRSSEWNEEASLAVVDADIAVTATDVTLREILSADKGCNAIKDLGWLMFGGFEDGAEIIAEPLLDEHIVVGAAAATAATNDGSDGGGGGGGSVVTFSGMIAFHFAVKAPAKQIQWRGRSLLKR